jgi:hypothetical protein
MAASASGPGRQPSIGMETQALSGLGEVGRNGIRAMMGWYTIRIGLALGAAIYWGFQHWPLFVIQCP